MRIMFTVQGDGRGHMTQAIAAAQILERQGHEIVAVTVGSNPSRTIPAFFRDAFGPRLHPMPSPGFALQGGRGVAALATLRQTLSGAGAYVRSLHFLRQTLGRVRPDVVVNFLEPLMGLLNLIHPPRVPVLAVGHHFLMEHPSFVKSSRFRLQQWIMRQYVGLAGAGATRYALSFYPAQPLPGRRLVVGPPLLRRSLFDLPVDHQGRFLLAYVLNQGYADEIQRWHGLFPEVELHCFCERPRIEPVWRVDATLAFHKLDGDKFLRMMAECRGLACTAGFESLNEAAWLGKPLLVVPVENHVEQHLNALDATRAGLATTGERFDLTPLLRQPRQPDRAAYRAWVGRAENCFLSAIEQALEPTSCAPLLPDYSTTVPERALQRTAP